MERLDLTGYEFQERKNLFDQLPTDETLLKEAKVRGFYERNTDYNHMFSEMFFNGVSVHYKPGIDKEYSRRVTKYIKELASSFSPKHEDKEAVCAMLLSEIAEVRSDKD